MSKKKKNNEKRRKAATIKQMNTYNRFVYSILVFSDNHESIHLLTNVAVESNIN